jgi:hypothetical protein
LACHSDYRYFFTCGNGVSMQPPSNQAMHPIAKAMFALCISYSCD